MYLYACIQSYTIYMFGFCYREYDSVINKKIFIKIIQYKIM